ncbi:SDR family oxidoreductase [Stratiformator vulcanicus]|uniref:Putative sugar epimerase YhfK n=1 Tax=Stratiformator vulcanicus TaxID=2527980 RepID=A0A517R492_9PLAN|nr:SDR family oxidoreductase [Stratiformator vulcanicus]QDT38681.1 putative sugar epimerase YhfK [Stratiformator vulcanicus]
MRVLVIGANGRTGGLCIKRLAESDHQPVAMIRRPEQQIAFTEAGIPTVRGDLEHPIDEAVQGCDAVIFAAGSGGNTGKDKTVLIDHLGGIRAAVAAATNGVKRFLMLSSMNSTPTAQTPIKHYHRAKAAADDFLMNMDQVLDEPLDWTIVAPGRLNDDESTGFVEIRSEITGSGSTSRAHTADVLVACLDLPNTVGKRFAVIDGAQPMNEALADI